MRVSISTLTLLASTPVIGFAATVTVDPSASNSILFRDYTSAPGNSTFNNAQLQSADGGGTTIYASNGTSTDPQVTHSGGSLDLVTYPNFRTRMSVSGGVNPVHVWRNPAAGGQNLAFSATGTLAEYQGTIPNPAGSVTGFRIDPVENGTGWTAEMDYIYIDRGRTIGYEFSHDGDDLGLSYGNFIPTVGSGAMTGTAAPGGGGASDVTISFPTSIDPSIYKYVEITMTGFAGDRIDFFFSNANPEIHTYAFEPSSDGQKHTYLLDFTAEPDWSGTLDFLRLDPSVSANATFSVDSVRFYETVLIPEPSSLLLSLFAVGLFLRRRR